MPKTLTEKLNAIKAAGKGIFVPYIMAGDHEKGLDGLAETIHFLEDLGVSAIEVGIPFSDPVADGPVIEEAGLRSLAHGTSTQALVETLKTIETEIPLVIMTYFNPLFQYGVENFVKDLADTAVKGLIIPDLPHEHANFVEPFLADTDIALIPLVSLTTGIERQKELIEGAEGFIYAVAINGVTGKSGNYRADLDKHLAQLHQVADIPVLTGFGVSSQADLGTLQCGVRWCYRRFENSKSSPPRRADSGLYQTSSSLPKIIKQVASKRKGTKGSLSFFFCRRKASFIVN
ncbi:tryptophan synthase subunit alpha [Streptococcus pneumoniae]|nr:tryptophan synthase subunit alpha [Streptococcus pneumoniae]